MNRIKRYADQVFKDNKTQFSEDFDENKKVLVKLATVRSKELKNEIAGFITRTIKKERKDAQDRYRHALADSAQQEVVIEPESDSSVETVKKPKDRSVKIVKPKDRSADIISEQNERVKFVKKLLTLGESDTLEYKESLWANMKNKGEKDDRMIETVVRTMCAFMNKEGGNLLIGVKDDKTVLGLEKDYAILSDQDGFQKRVSDMLKNYFELQIPPGTVKTNFVIIGNLEICHCDIKKILTPVYIKKGANKKACFVREQSTNQELVGDQLTKFCIDRKMEETRRFLPGANLNKEWRS